MWALQVTLAIKGILEVECEINKGHFLQPYGIVAYSHTCCCSFRKILEENMHANSL